MDKSVALFLVDGMRPDGLQQAETPVLDRLIVMGSHTLAARTVMPSVTLPCCMSLFHGVRPERHGITTNVWTVSVRPVPSLSEVIRQAGRRTAAFYNWEELRDLSPTGALSASLMLANCEDAGGDAELAELAAGWQARNPVDFAFVYFGYVDQAGHDHGWMSAEYLAAIANADWCIGKVLDALPRDGIVIVTSDHGGHGRTHGTDCDEDLRIPLIIAGPGIPRAETITRPIHITDVAPTVAALLGLTPPAAWDGRSMVADTRPRPPTSG